MDVCDTAFILHTVAASAELRGIAFSDPLQHVLTQTKVCCAQRLAYYIMTALMLTVR